MSDPTPEEQEPREDPWAPVDDLAAPDLEAAEPAEPAPEPPRLDPWDAVDDRDADDVALPTEARVEAEDPWVPVDEEPVPIPPPPASPPLPPPLPDAPDAPAAKRSLPWRGVASSSAPVIEALLCTCDSTAAASTLLVAAFERVGDRLQFRLSDDGSWFEARSAGGDSVDLALRFGGQDLTVRAGLSVGAGHRGLRIGRDALAGRFVIDLTEPA